MIARKVRKPDKKYIVIVADGIYGEFCPVHQILGYNEGKVFYYKHKNGLEDFVFASSKYRPLQVDGTAFIGKQVGNDSACCVCKLLNEGATKEVEIEINGQKKKVLEAVRIIGNPNDPDCPGEDLSRLGRSNFFGTGIKTIYKPFEIPWKPVIIIGIAIVVIILVIKFGLPHLAALFHTGG